MISFQQLMETSQSVAAVIISVALMLFSGFLMTRITKLLRLPNVTAYIVAGILIGPYCLDLVPQRIIDGTDFLSDIALAFIAFSTGEFFKLSVLKKSGMRVVWITLFEAVLASVFVFILTYFVLRLELAFSIVLAALGAGLYTPALVLFLVLLCSMSGLPVLEKHLKDRSNHFEVHLELKNKGDLADFVATIRALGIRIDDIESNPAYIGSGLSVFSVSFTITCQELKLESYEKQIERHSFPKCLNILCDYAAEQGMIADTIAERDLFDTRLMGCVTPRPSEVVRKFWSLYAESPKAATDYFYKLSQDCNYIRRDRIAKDEHWTTETKYGELEISINLSKPEKDPRDIAAAKLKKASGYPKCLLCVENVGYAGTISHPARQNLRVMPVTVNGQPWGFQYSPYVYYNEHAIVMNTQHTPMVIDRSAFDKLFSFVEQFPHYFLGSNADLPIVGGSILAHEHFQGGHHTFPMEKAEKEFGFEVPGFENVDCCVVKYPMTVLRLNSENKNQLCDLAGRILAKWRKYSDPDAMIFAETGGEPHNTITPIARMRNGKYELDLVLRNNLTTKEHPMGIYHPHEELHHIKKENIGLIEVMGLAILPGRLKKEMADLKEALLNGEDLRASETLAKHADWAEEFMGRHPEFNADNAEEIIKDEIGQVFAKVLECAGVYKCTAEGREHLKKFLTEVQNG